MNINQSKKHRFLSARPYLTIMVLALLVFVVAVCSTPTVFGQNGTVDLVKNTGFSKWPTEQKKEVTIATNDSSNTSHSTQSLANTIPARFGFMLPGTESAGTKDAPHPEAGVFANSNGGKELPLKRDAYSKHYLNHDGSGTVQTSNMPVHYQNEDGLWLTIDPKITINDSKTHLEYGFANTSNNLKSFYPENISQGVLTEIEGVEFKELSSLNMYYVNEGNQIIGQPANATNGFVNGNSITYPEVYSSIDLRLTSKRGKRKVDYVVRSADAFGNVPANAKYIVFEETVHLPKNMSVKRLKTGELLLIDNNRDTVAVYEFPSIEDASIPNYQDVRDSAPSDPPTGGNKGNAFIQLKDTLIDGTLKLRLKVGLDWLRSPDRVFPITIDPSISASSSSATLYSNGTNCVSATTSGAPAGSTITSVVFSFSPSNTAWLCGGCGSCGATYNCGPWWCWWCECCAWYYDTWEYYSGSCGSYHSWNFEGINNVCSNQTFSTQFDGNNPNNTWNLCLTSADGYTYRADVNFSVTVNYDVPCTNPVITSNPSNRTVCENATGNFNVSATGTSLTYQWQYSSNNSTWTNIVGTWGETGYTSTSLGITNPQTHGWSGYYFRCVVYSNGICTGNSGSATLTVQTSPTAPTTIEGEANGGSTNLCEGAAITLDAGGGSNGSGATYQWYAGSTCCSGSSLGSGSTLNITPPATGQTYHVRRVGNTACTATTGSVSHRIYSRPLTDDITSVSGTNSLCEGESTTLTANGGALIHYPFTSNVNDASGNGWNLTGSGGTFSAQGITLTTSSSYQTAPTNVLNTDVHTVAFKLRFDGGPTTAYNQIFRWADSNFGNRSPGVWRYPNSNQMHWRYELDGTTCCAPAGSNSGISEANIYTPGTFYDIVMVKNGGTLSLYIDGALYASAAVSNPKNGGLTPLVFGGANVTLRDFRIYAADLRWYTGGCTGTYIGSGPSITVTPPAGNTTYYVRAEGECNTGTCRSRAVTVYDEPAAEAGPSRSNCNSTAYTLPAGASVTGSYSNYYWTYSVNSGFVASVTGTTTLTPTINPSSAAGSVTLTLNVVGTSPCADTDDSMTFTWSSAPTADAGTDQTQCGNTANFTFSGATASTPSTWAWSVVAGSGNGSLINGGATLTNWGFNPSTPSGTATIRLTVTGTGTCTGATATDDIVVSWIEPATLSLSSPIVSCNGDDPIDITGQTANGFFGDVSWTGGETDGSWSTGINGYYDDFSTNTSANYSMTSQANTSWNWSGGLLYSDATPGGDGYSYARYTGINVANRDIVIEYDMMQDGVDWGGLEYRGIYCDVNTTRTGWRDDNGVYGAGIAGANTWHHIKMVITMATPYPLSTLYVDGAVVFANEPIQRAAAWPRTDVGFVSSHYSPYRHYFNNFKVSEQASVFTYTPNTGVNQGAFTAYVTANGIGQCASTDPTGNITVSWGTAPTATAGTPQTTCGTDAHPMTGATVSGTYSSVAWTGGAANGTWSNTSTTNPAQWTFTPNAGYAASGGSFTATLTVTGGSGPSTACVGSDFTTTRTITIDPLPQANAGGPNEVCTGDDPIPMTGASASNFSSYEWTIGLTTTGWNQASSVPTATFTPTSLDGTATALLTVEGSGTCSAKTDSDTRTLIWHTPPEITFVQGTDVTDCNSANGSILINASANETLEYSINNGSTYQSGNVFSGLSGDNYTVIVRGVTTNCTTPYSGNPVVIGTTPPVTASVSVAAHSLCAGQPFGSILIQGLTGGGAPYDYTLSGQASNRWNLLPSDPYTVPNVSAGTYLVVVRDRFGCMSAEYSITINEPSPITITALNITDIGGCGGTGTGAIAVTASGGTGTLNYSLNSIDNSPITSNSWSNLVGGSYEVGITDANGCQTVAQAQINAPWTLSAGNDLTICSGETVTLQGNIVGEYPSSCTISCASGCGLTASCAASGGDDDDWITRVQFNAINNPSGQTTYTDFTAVSTTVAEGSTYNLSVEVSKCCSNTSWSQCVRVFFDWTRDGDFNDANEYYDLGCGTANPFTLSTNITVPSNVTAGNVRMRVTEQYSGYFDASGCGSTTYAEVEDYTINVQKIGPCTPTISWTGGPTGFSYNVSPTTPTTYTLNMNDGAGCAQSATVDVNVSDLDAVETLTQISCNGDDDGCIEINAVNEVGPYLMKLGSTVQVYGGSMKEVTVTNTNGTLTNHPVKISSVAWTAPMRADFGDVRFYDANLNELSYWIESYTNSGSMDVWVKFPSLGASATIYMTYGNSSLSSESDGEAVFTFFDDFDFFDSGKWTQGVTGATSGTDWSYYGGNLIGGNSNRIQSSISLFSGAQITETMQITTSSPTNGFTPLSLWTSTSQGVSFLHHASSNRIYARNDATWNNQGNNHISYNLGEWTRSVIKHNNNIANFSRINSSGVEELNVNYTNGTLSNATVRFGNRHDNSNYDQNYNSEWDWVFVRPYAATEPTASIGAIITADNEFCDLPPASYSVLVVDMGNCSETVNFTISEPTVLTLAQDNYAITCNGLTNGNIDITVSGGTPTYYYNWAGPSSYSSSSEDITGLAPGNYNVTVADDNACTINGSFVVNEFPAVPAVPYVSNDGPICTGNTADLTASGMAPGGQAVDFSTGTFSYVNAPHNTSYDLPNSSTIEAWIRPSTISGQQIIFNKENAYEAAIFPDGTIQWAYNTTSPGWTWRSTGHVVSVNEWIHVAFVRDFASSLMKTYVNGILVHSLAMTGPLASNTSPFKIGNRSSNSPFYGTIDNVRVWNTARTSTEIRDNMYLETPLSSTGLVAHYPLNGDGNASPGVNGTLTNAGGASYVDADYFTYTWTGTNAPSASTDETQTTSALTATQNYSVIATTAEGCSSTASGNTTVTVDNTAPTNIGVTISDDCWITDNSNTYTITAVVSDAGFGVNDVRVLINWQGDNTGAANRGGYVGWRKTSHLWTADQINISGGYGGYASKVVSATDYGQNHITLVDATSSISGNTVTINFVVRPHADFPEVCGNHDISLYSIDVCGTVNNWDNSVLSFTAMQTPSTPTTSLSSVCSGSSVTLTRGNAPVGGITYYWQTSTTGTDMTYSGATYSPSPTSATTYYVRPYCAATTCWGTASSGVTVNITNNATAIGTWVGSQSSDWADCRNWGGGVVPDGIDVQIPNGSPNDPIISSAVADVLSINIQASGDLRVNAGGSLTTTSNTFSGAGLQNYGYFGITGGSVSFTNGFGLIQYGNGNFTMTGGTFYTNGWLYNVNGQTNVQMNISGGYLDVNRIPNYAGVINHSGGTIDCRGYYNEYDATGPGAYNGSGTAVINFRGTSNQYLKLFNTATEFNDVNIYGTAYYLDASGSTGLDVDGDFTIQSGGKLDANGWQMDMAGDWTNDGTFTHDNNVVYFDGTGAQNINSGGTGAGKQFYDVFVTNGGTATLQTNAVNIDGDFTISSGAALDANGETMYVFGDWSNSGTFTNSSNTVYFDGTGAQDINAGGTGATKQFYNVYVTNGGTVTLSSDMEVDRTFDVQGGTFTMTDQNLYTLNAVVGGIAQISAGATMIVNGASSQWRSSASNNGGTNIYGLLTLNDGTVHSGAGMRLYSTGTVNQAGGRIGSGDEFRIDGDFNGNGGVLQLWGGGDFNAPRLYVTNASAYFYNLEADDDGTNRCNFNVSSQPIVVTNDVTIMTGANHLDANGVDMKVGGNWVNNGNVQGSYVGYTADGNKVEFTGNANISGSAKTSFYDVLNTSGTRTQMVDTDVLSTLGVTGGTYKVNAGQTLAFASGGVATISNGGTFYGAGTSGNLAAVTSISGSYQFNVNGAMQAVYTSFSNMGGNGIDLSSATASFPSAAQDFDNCSFNNWTGGQALLLRDNLGISGSAMTFVNAGGTNISHVNPASSNAVVTVTGGTGSRWGEAYDGEAEGGTFSRINWSDTYTFTVSGSDFGSGTPADGTYYYGNESGNNAPSASVSAVSGSCLSGYTGTGSAPSGTGNTSPAFHITQNSTLTWNWNTPSTVMLWNGTTSDGDWHDPVNWGCYGIPNASSNVTIPATSNDPHIFNGQGDCNKIDIDTDGGAHLFVDPGGILKVHQ